MLPQSCPTNGVHFRESFIDAYRDSIINCITLHNVWLKDNLVLFRYAKFREVLNKQFLDDLKRVDLVI